MSAPVTKYTDLVTSQHADKLNFLAALTISCQPLADLSALLSNIPHLFDVDYAEGQQLDVVGQWVGVTRDLSVPISGVYFAFDTAGVGFDEGVWMGPYDPATGITQLSDYYYRILIKIRILNNHWDGSLSSAYDLVNQIFGALGYTFFIQDHCDLTIDFGIIGTTPPDALIKALLISGKFNVKPAGVHINNYFYQSEPGPMFAFDLSTPLFAGFDTGAWAVAISN